jgi:hypothetical protein
VVGGHFVVDISTKKILDAKYWWPLYSRILMTFAKTMIVVRKLEDSKQKVWPSW